MPVTRVVLFSGDPICGGTGRFSSWDAEISGASKAGASVSEKMQSLDEPWTEEEGDGSDHPYYNSIPSKMPPPGGFLDARLKPRPHASDTAQFAGKEQTYYQGRHLGDTFGEDWQQTPFRQSERQEYTLHAGRAFVPKGTEKLTSQVHLHPSFRQELVRQLEARMPNLTRLFNGESVLRNRRVETQCMMSQAVFPRLEDILARSQQCVVTSSEEENVTDGNLQEFSHLQTEELLCEALGSLDIYSMPEGKLHMAPTGEAPTYVNTQQIPPQAWPAVVSSAESSPRKDLFDMSGFPFVPGFLLF
ncbi:hypothetical protein P7K49_000566 [Saguinus oedipus]|uniref:Uncharacterized protein n=1 Tax=Saguinus oedipus TaxID=9490 RepID=A0ABQ9WBZ5_SAGOE|nr:hypothetical protein P7K49_000566 [Saguinus oedipus]